MVVMDLIMYIALSKQGCSILLLFNEKMLLPYVQSNGVSLPQICRRVPDRVRRIVRLTNPVGWWYSYSEGSCAVCSRVQLMS